MKCKSQEQFISELQIALGNKNYDFSKAKYVNRNTKVCVICNEVDVLGRKHGEFWAQPKHLLKGHGCPRCAHRYLTTEEVVAMAKNVHGDRYDYSLLEYHNNNSERLPIICHEKDENGNEHGSFSPVWSSHLTGVGCPKCNGGVRYDKEMFVKRASEVHGSKYHYDKFIYKNANTCGIITCPRHGDFLQTPYLHINRGFGCPKCKSSKLEAMMQFALDKFKLPYQKNVKVEALGRQTIDFFIPSKNLYIECQGEQHYAPTKFSPNMSDGEAERIFQNRVSIDKEKYEAVMSMGSNMIYFTDPRTFHVKGVDVNSGFYSDKLVFIDINGILGYLTGLKMPNTECVISESFDSFFKDVLSLAEDAEIDYGRIKCGKKLIYFNETDKPNSKNISERNRACFRRGYFAIDVFEEEYISNRQMVIDKVRDFLMNEND